MLYDVNSSNCAWRAISRLLFLHCKKCSTIQFTYVCNQIDLTCIINCFFLQAWKDLMAKEVTLVCPVFLEWMVTLVLRVSLVLMEFQVKYQISFILLYSTKSKLKGYQGILNFYLFHINRDGQTRTYFKRNGIKLCFGL